MERQKIAAEENRKARLVVATDLDQTAKEIEGLREVLQQRDVKLAEAQKAQAQLIRKERELHDARRDRPYDRKEGSGIAGDDPGKGKERCRRETATEGQGAGGTDSVNAATD